MKQLKLLILGASLTQLPIIKKAVELGYYVITLDNIPSSIGHQFSHQSVNCSTADQISVLKLSQQLNINGITTFASDIATLTVAFVAKSLNLPSCPLSTTNILANKANFRLFQETNDLSHPRFFISKNSTDIANLPAHLTAPLIFKPIDTSGSRGITKVDHFNINHYRDAYNHAQQYSRSKTVSIEQFMIGTDVSGDGFLINGKLHAFITQKYKHNFIPIGHSLPNNISDEDEKRILTTVEQTCHAANYFNGPIDFDVNISAQHTMVIEMSPRLGGNGIPELINHHTGIDLIEMSIEYALGKPLKAPVESIQTYPCGSYIFGSEKAGQLEYIASKQDLHKQLPKLLKYQLNYAQGDAIPAFDHSGNSLGYALFAYAPEESYTQIVSRLQSALQLRVTTPNSVDAGKYTMVTETH